jgi:hypothetical protein
LRYFIKYLLYNCHWGYHWYEFIANARVYTLQTSQSAGYGKKLCHWHQEDGEKCLGIAFGILPLSISILQMSFVLKKYKQQNDGGKVGEKRRLVLASES